MTSKSRPVEGIASSNYCIRLWGYSATPKEVCRRGTEDLGPLASHASHKRLQMAAAPVSPDCKPGHFKEARILSAQLRPKG